MVGFKDLHFKLRGFRLRYFRIRKKRSENKASWMIPISHGYYVDQDQSFRIRGEQVVDDDDDHLDSVVIQRETIQGVDVCFFGVFDSNVGDNITNYMQSHFFHTTPKQGQIRKKSREVMRKAYLAEKTKLRETPKSSDHDQILSIGSASMMLINGEKLVIANMGNYRVVVCRNYKAYQISSSRDATAAKRHWSRRLFSVPLLGWNSGRLTSRKQQKRFELVVGDERFDDDTEFVIIASNGIWETMMNQEAVNLIGHLVDPRDAAACLAKEAINRHSKSSIACIVVRFD